MTRCHVIIIGAGIGGLTAALSLQRHGFKVSVYEQACKLQELGAGLLVTPNAMHALNHLGVGDRVAEASNASGETLFKHYKTGAILQRRPGSGDYESRYGAGHFRVHRADLHNALSAAVLQNDPSCIHLDHTFSEMSQDESAVAAQFVNGAAATGDALIGCDGGRSRVRDTLYGSKPVSYTGQAAFRALIPIARFPETLRSQSQCLYIGPRRMLLHYPLRKNLLLNVVAIAQQPQWQDEGWTIPAEIGELSALYSDFHPEAMRLIELIEPTMLFKWGLRDRDPSPRWTLGRASLLGDAAHPMSPFLGQGAVMAIEDGMVLGRCFAQANSPQEALRLYEGTRKLRANAIQLRSRERASALQASSPGHVEPGDAEDLGLFEYDPTSVSLGGGVINATPLTDESELPPLRSF
jgi:salicylate hydroxylase